LRLKGRSIRRAVCAGLVLSAFLLCWAATAQAQVYQQIPLADPNFSPHSVTSDTLRQIFVSGTNQNGGVVQRLDPQQGYAVAETLPFGSLVNPAGIAWQPGSEALYVLDKRPGGSVVLKLEKGAPAPTVLPFGPIDPTATQIAVNAEGEVFVAEDAEHKVLELASGATSPVTVPITGLEGAAGITVADELLVVSDENAKRIVEYNLLTETQSSFALPNGDVPVLVSFNHYGSLYTFDSTTGDVVEQFGPGEFITLDAGAPGSTPGGIATVGQGGTLGGVFLTNVPRSGLYENVDTEATPPKISSPFIDDGDGKIDVPLAVNDPHNITVPFTYEVANSKGEEFRGFTVFSSKDSVLPASNVTISRVGVSKEYRMSFEPLAPGSVQLTLIATISPGEAVLSLFGTQAMAPSVGPQPANANQRFLFGASDASSQLAVGGGYFLDVDDESPALRLYKNDTTGFPLKSWVTPGLGEDTDFEALARSGNKVFQADSFAEGVGFSPIVEYTIRGEGAETELSTKAVYYGLEQELIAWDNSRGAPLGLQASSETSQKEADGSGLALEGLEFAPDGTTAYLGFRVPLQPANGGPRTESLIIPVKNFAALFAPGNTAPAEFGTPIIWNLGGLGIREIRKNAHDEYLIISGGPGDVPKETVGRQALWAWDGVPTDAPRELKTKFMETAPPLLHGITGWEGIVEVPDPLVQGAKVTLVQDDGKSEPWGAHTTTQKKMTENQQKSMTDTFTIDFGAPEHTVAPSISGYAAVGLLLTCEPGTWTTSPTYAYGWLRDGTSVASGQTYTPVAADLGRQLTCEVTATNGEGSSHAVSAAVVPVMTGPAGPSGPQGATGDTGSKGAAGEPGAKGDTGSKGDPGAAGPIGPAGARGPQGNRGKSAAVTCKVTGSKKDPHVTCAVQYGNGGSGNDRVLRLVRHGHVVARGRGSHLQLTGTLPSGSYTLVVGTGKTADRFAVTVG
jgi:hypothetical protein